jgi:hypothetical protein
VWNLLLVFALLLSVEKAVKADMCCLSVHLFVSFLVDITSVRKTRNGLQIDIECVDVSLLLSYSSF